jgi:N-formylglutamate deformylase
MMLAYPPWVVLHIPHASTLIPIAVRDQFVLTDAALEIEAMLMADLRTVQIFSNDDGKHQAITAMVSRLVVDVERFTDDVHEPMANIGMGAVYKVTSNLSRLRRELSAAEEMQLMDTYYKPHHAELEAAVETCIESYGCCLILDCHSFANKALPYEMADAVDVRPDICIGTDPFHTDQKLTQSFKNSFEQAGWHVEMNSPFSGAIVPASRYKKDTRVQSVMVEINKRLYLAENSINYKGSPEDFAAFALAIRQVCCAAIRAWSDLV